MAVPHGSRTIIKMSRVARDPSRFLTDITAMPFLTATAHLIMSEIVWTAKVSRRMSLT